MIVTINDKFSMNLEELVKLTNTCSFITCETIAREAGARVTPDSISTSLTASMCTQDTLIDIITAMLIAC